MTASSCSVLGKEGLWYALCYAVNVQKKYPTDSHVLDILKLAVCTIKELHIPAYAGHLVPSSLQGYGLPLNLR